MKTDETAARGEGDRKEDLERKEEKRRRTKRRRNTSDIINDFSVIISVFTDLESLVDRSPCTTVFTLALCIALHL